MLDMWADMKDHTQPTIRMGFIVKCTFIAYYILTGEKIEGFGAQVAHFQKFSRCRK